MSTGFRPPIPHPRFLCADYGQLAALGPNVMPVEHYADELEEELDDAILHDFNVEAEDGSPRQVWIKRAEGDQITRGERGTLRCAAG